MLSVRTHVCIGAKSGHHVAFTARAPAEQEILRAMRGAMRQQGHDVLTREPAPVSIGSRLLLRAGSGAG